MRANRTAPNKLEFTYYKCRVISKNIESLVDAQLKADKAQYTSDVSDFDNRKKKDKKKYSSVKFAPEKTQKNNITTFPLSEFDDKLIGLTNEEYNSIDVQEATNKDKTKKIKLSDSNHKELEHNSCTYLNTPASTKHMQPQSNTSAVSPVSANAGFQKLALNYLVSLKIEMTKLSETQQEILTFIQTNNMVCELSRIGGKSLQNMIYKIMKRVFEDSILIQYTYYGLRNKENFSLLAINRAIFDAIKRSKFKNVTDDEIITTIGKWLTSAKSRLNKNVLQI